MSEEPKTEKNIADELNKLGKQVADAIKAAWESDDRKKLQAEITDGLEKFGSQVSEALDHVGKSETAQDLRVKAEKVVTDAREKGVVEDIRKGVLAGLDAVNKELGKLVEKLETKPAAEAPEAPEAAEAPEAPAETAEPEPPAAG